MTEPDDRRAIRRLELRVEQLEQTVAAGGAGIAAALLVVGTVLRFAVEEVEEYADGPDLDSGSLLTFGVRAAGGEAGGVLLGVCLLALVAVTLVALGTLYAIASDSVTPLISRVITVVALALAAGALLVGGYAISLTGPDDGGAPGPGALLFVLGALAYDATAWSRLRQRWDPLQQGRIS